MSGRSSAPTPAIPPVVHLHRAAGTLPSCASNPDPEDTMPPNTSPVAPSNPSHGPGHMPGSVPATPFPATPIPVHRPPPGWNPLAPGAPRGR